MNQAPEPPPELPPDSTPASPRDAPAETPAPALSTTFAEPSQDSHWHPLPALAAWFVPGLGHLLLGERRRGGILFVAIMILWLTGWLIGGIGVFDRTQHTFWTAGQSMLAPSLIPIVRVDRWRAENPYLETDAEPPYEPSYGKVNEQGVLFTGIAGMLNLLAILDVLYREPRPRPRGRTIDLGATT